MNKIKKRNILNLLVPSKFFLKLFCVPSVIWLIISCLTMIPDESDPVTITWWQSIIVDIFLILVWYIISYVISLIINEIKNSRPKTKVVKEIQYITKEIPKRTEKNTEEKISMPKRKINDKCLYTCESVLNAYEYKKMAKYFPRGTYWTFVSRGIYLNIIFTFIIAMIYENFWVTLFFFVGYQLYLMLFYKIGLEECCERYYNSFVKKGFPPETLFETEFYDDYFIRKTKNASVILKYSDMVKSVETKTHFYFDYPQRSTVIIMQKDKCDSELIDFIRKKCYHLENKIKD